ncbi:UNVERIFIED_CONTAM: hypothetical protein HDU68_003419, partial [Siphonaria sp. JEL0065]
LVIWINGGPGCSLLIGQFTENGPFYVSDARSLVVNLSSWHNRANILYVDQPIGAGFSFTKPKTGPHDEYEVGKQFYTFLKQWYLIFGVGAAAAIGQHYSKSPLANITSIDSVSSLYSFPKVGSPVTSLTTVATQDTSGAGISSGGSNSNTGVANNGGNFFSSGKRFLEPESAAEQLPFHIKAFRGV